MRRPLILENKLKPTVTHFFQRILHDKGKLRSIFTQNIDGIDYLCGIPDCNILPVHGALKVIKCEGCGHKPDQAWFAEEVRKNIKDISGEDPDAPSESSQIMCTKCN